MVKKLAAEERQSYVGMALGFCLFALLVTSVVETRPPASPAAMVQAQVVRGEKICLTAATAVPDTNTNTMTVLSNSIAATSPTNAPSSPGQTSPMALRPKLAAADSNSFPEVIEQGGRNYLNLTFAKLASFPFKVTPEMADATKDPQVASQLTRKQVPDAIQNLSEKPAAITGFMLPVRLNGGVASDFLLLRNQSACCYGIMPRVNEWVIVHATGKGVKMVMDVPVTAVGTFHVGEMRENGRLMGIYFLECDELLPTKLSL